ncbi:hypothetical protein ACQR5T_09680 [Xanthomonas oryzae pv. oryzicola]|nr:hypothetical protein [Xanthomonas oryzae]
MIAQLTDVLARVHGNDTCAQDFMLVRRPAASVDDAATRSQQLIELFQAASLRNVVD